MTENAAFKIFVGGLPKEIGGSELGVQLFTYFSQFGSVAYADVKCDTQGLNRGFGFVEFNDRAGVDAVMRLYDQHTVCGKWVDVKRFEDLDKPGLPGGDMFGAAKPPLAMPGTLKAPSPALPMLPVPGFNPMDMGGLGVPPLPPPGPMAPGLINPAGLVGLANPIPSPVDVAMRAGFKTQVQANVSGKVPAGAPVPSGAEEPKVFVGAIPRNVTSKMLHDYFKEFGQIIKAEVSVDKDSGASKGFGFVHFATLEGMKKCLDKGEHILEGKKFEVRQFGDRTRATAGTKPDKQTTDKDRKRRTIFVGGLPRSCDGDRLFSHFSRFGTVVKTDVLMDTTTGISRGFGFVEFAEESGVDACLKQSNSHQIEGKYFDVKRFGDNRPEPGHARKKEEVEKEEAPVAAAPVYDPQKLQEIFSGDPSTAFNPAAALIGQVTPDPATQVALYQQLQGLDMQSQSAFLQQMQKIADAKKDEAAKQAQAAEAPPPPVAPPPAPVFQPPPPVPQPLYEAPALPPAPIPTMNGGMATMPMPTMAPLPPMPPMPAPPAVPVNNGGATSLDLKTKRHVQQLRTLAALCSLAVVKTPPSYGAAQMGAPVRSGPY